MAEEDFINIFIGIPPKPSRLRPQTKMDPPKKSKDKGTNEQMDENLMIGTPEEIARKVVENNKTYCHYYAEIEGPSRLHFLSPLGEGSYSTVYLARDTAQGPDAIPRYAVKVLEKMHIVKSDMVLQILREKKVLEYLNFHSSGLIFLPKLYCTFQDDKYMYSVMNVCERGEFGQFFRGGKSILDLDTTKFYAAEILTALDFIHQNGICHRDLKPENILLAMDGHICLVDFGSCAIFKTEVEHLNVGVIMHPPRKPRLSDYMEGMEHLDPPEPVKEENEETYERTRRSTFVGTAQYVSPEMLRGDLVGPECDLWAFGVILYQMITGTTPFRAMNDYQMMKRIRAVNYTFPENFDPDAKDIITHLLTDKPEQRYTMEDLKSHNFFKGVNWNIAKIQERTPPPAYAYIPVKYDRINEPKYWADIPTGFNERIAAQLLNNQLRDSATQAIEIHNHSDSLFDFSDDLEAPDDCVASEAMQALIKKTREMRILKEKLKRQAETNSFAQFAQDKLILKQGMLGKKKGMFSRDRMFVMTEGPRLYYVKVDNMEFKGEVPFSPFLTCEVKDFRIFYIHTPRRVYYLFDPESKALDWCKAIMELKSRYEERLQEMWADAMLRKVWPAVDIDKKALRDSEKERLKQVKKAKRGPGHKNALVRFLRFFKIG